MINKEMNENQPEKKPELALSNKAERKPNEIVGYYFSSSIKIFDPNSQEVILHTRGDD